MSIKKVGYIIVLLGIFFFSCAQGENEKHVGNEVVLQNKQKVEEIQIKILEENKTLIKNFYDDVSYEIVNLILEERVYKTNGNNIVLKAIPLDSFPNRLQKDVEKNVKKYSVKLIEFKNQTISSLNKETLAGDFKKSKDDLINSSFYQEDIIGDRKSDSLYIKLTNKINKIYESTQDKISVLNEASLQPLKMLKMTSGDNISLPEKLDNSILMSFSKILKKYSWWLFGLLVISILLHFFQVFICRKQRVQFQDKLDVERARKNRPTNNSQRRQKQPETLHNSEVKALVAAAYVELQRLLSSKYHRDCVESISGKCDHLKSQSTALIISKNFTSTQEVKRAIQQQIKQDEAILISELTTCVLKQDATRIINDEIVVEAFAKAYNVSIISENEVESKIEQLKQFVILELPETISKSKLNESLSELKKDIVMALQKMVADSLVYYFPFADSDGTLEDTKKTNRLERDSAIKLSIDPEDITKARFRLLLEKNDMMMAGIMSYDSLLVPICDLLNENFNRSGTTIEPIGSKYGTMELKNDTWKVKNKLPIKII